MEAACELAQAFTQMIRQRHVFALESWLEAAISSGVPEMQTFAIGIKRDQLAIQAALTQEWSQGQVEGQIHRLKLLKRQSYGRAGFDLLRLVSLQGLLEVSTEDDAEPNYWVHYNVIPPAFPCYHRFWLRADYPQGHQL